MKHLKNKQTLNTYFLLGLEDPTLADKEAILASLNIKAMRFDEMLGFNQRGPSMGGISPLGSPSLAAINKQGATTGYPCV